MNWTNPIEQKEIGSIRVRFVRGDRILWKTCDKNHNEAALKVSKTCFIHIDSWIEDNFSHLLFLVLVVLSHFMSFIGSIFSSTKWSMVKEAIVHHLKILSPGYKQSSANPQTPLLTSTSSKHKQSKKLRKYNAVLTWLLFVLFLVLFMSCCWVIYVFGAATFAVSVLKRFLLRAAIFLVKWVGGGASLCMVRTLSGWVYRH